MTPPRIRGLVDRLERAALVYAHAKGANKAPAKAALLAAKMDVLRAFAVVAGPPADVGELVGALRGMTPDDPIERYEDDHWHKDGWICPHCNDYADWRDGQKPEDIKHKENCPWVAARAALAKRDGAK